MIKNYKWILGGLILVNIGLFVFANRDEALGNSATVRGREVEVIVDDFSGGITDNKNTNDYRFSQMLKNFEVRDGRLIPYRDSEAGDVVGSDTFNIREIQAFTFGNNQLWGYGVPHGQSQAQASTSVAVFNKVSSALTTGSWTDPVSSSTSLGNRNTDLFIHYKNFIYGASGLSDGTIWRHGDITATAANRTTASWQTIAFTNIAQGVWHSKDDNLYIPYDNKILKFDGGTGEIITEALVLPTDKVINSIVEYGHYLAIGTATIYESVTGVSPSVVYLWDRDTSLTGVNEIIDWGTGSLEILGVVDGFLVGISHSPVQASGGDAPSFNSKITIRVYDGQKAVKLFELTGDTPYTAQDLEGAAIKHGEGLYFPLAITIDGTLHEGIWKLYRPSPQAGFILTLDRTPDDNTVLTSRRIFDMFFWDDYLFIAYRNGNQIAVSKTNDLPSYTASSTIESVFYGDGIHQNILKSIGVVTEPIPQGGQIDILYKVDGDRAWTLATTSRNIGSMFTEIISNERDAAIFPQFTKAKFKFDSTGNATTTGYRIKYEILDNLKN